MNYKELFETYVKGLKERSNGQVVGYCPFHSDRKRSWSGNSDTGLWICHAGCGKGNAYQFAKRIGTDPRPFITKNISHRKSSRI